MPIHRRNIDHKLFQYLQSEGFAKEDQADVERWIARNDKNRAYFVQVKKLWEEKRFIEPLKTIDTDKIRAGLQKKIDRNRSVFDESSFFRGKRTWLWRAAAVAFILVVSSTTLLFVRINPGNPILEVSSTGEAFKLVLSDGSNIELNMGATLSYPKKLNRRKREVILTGEAFFEVVSNKHAPFCVYIGNTTVQVLGTSFNLKEDEGQITLSVITGEVRFFESGKKDQIIELGAGQQVIYRTAVGAFEQGTFESRNFLFWKTSTLTFNAEPITNVFGELGKYYNTPIEIANKIILQDRVTTSCEGQQLQEILDELSLMHDLHYARKNDTIYVYKKAQ